MEYRAVKASLLSAQQPTNVAMAEDLAESKTKEYPRFYRQFNKSIINITKIYLQRKYKKVDNMAQRK